MEWASKRQYNAIIKQECEDEDRPPPKYLSEFWEFHDNNPNVIEKYLELAIKRQEQGRKRIAIGKLTEDLRDDPTLITVDPAEGFKLRHSFRAYYARWLVLERPSLEPLIALRPLGERRRGRTQQHTTTHASNGVAKGRRIGAFWASGGEWPD